jgi:hypothetical protein
MQKDCPKKGVYAIVQRTPANSQITRTLSRCVRSLHYKQESAMVMNSKLAYKDAHQMTPHRTDMLIT